MQEGCPPNEIRFSQKRFKTEFTLADNSELGKGKYGQVFRARNNTDKREYAVKKILLRGQGSEDGSSWDEAQKEVERLSKLKHEYIVRYQSAWYERDDTVETTVTNTSNMVNLRSESVGPKPDVIMGSGNPSVDHQRLPSCDVSMTCTVVDQQMDVDALGQSNSSSMSSDIPQQMHLVVSDAVMTDRRDVCHEPLPLGVESECDTDLNVATEDKSDRPKYDFENPSVEIDSSDDSIPLFRKESRKCLPKNENREIISLRESYGVSKNESSHLTNALKSKANLGKDIDEPSSAKRRRLNSPGVLAILGTSKTYLFIQMELCHMTLRTWIKYRNSQISSEVDMHEPENIQQEILEILRKEWVETTPTDTDVPKSKWYLYIKESPTNNLLEGIVKGLKYLHGQEVAHQDLHLCNVLIFIDHCNKVTPRISDFGLAKTISFEPCSAGKICKDKKIVPLETDTCSHALQCKSDMGKLGDLIAQLYCFYQEVDEERFKTKWSTQAEWFEKLNSEDHVDRPTATAILRMGKERNIFQFKDEDEIKQLLAYEKLEKENEELKRELLLLKQGREATV